MEALLGAFVVVEGRHLRRNRPHLTGHRRRDSRRRRGVGRRCGYANSNTDRFEIRNGNIVSGRFADRFSDGSSKHNRGADASTDRSTNTTTNTDSNRRSYRAPGYLLLTRLIRASAFRPHPPT